MKALICRAFGPPESLVVGDLPDPVPGPANMVVDVAVAALNFPDVLSIQNKYQIKPTLPFSPGVEIAGRVAAVGANVAGFAVGDRVAAYVNFGGFAGKAIVEPINAAHIPDGVADEAAATLPINYATSYYALVDKGQIEAGETLLVLGASGGVGIAAVQVGKAFGATVIAAASSADKLALCREHGADVLVDYGARDLRDALKEVAPKGIDLVFDPVGGAYSEAAFRSVAWRGRFLTVGYANGEIPRIPLNLALLGEREIVGVAWGASAQRDRALFGRIMAAMFDLVVTGRVKPVVTDRVPLGRAAEAMRAMLDRKVTGKVIVQVG